MDSEKIQRPYPGAPIQVDGKHREKLSESRFHKGQRSGKGF